MKDSLGEKEVLLPCLNCKEEVGIYIDGKERFILCKFCGLSMAYSLTMSNLDRDTLIKIWNTRKFQPTPASKTLPGFTDTPQSDLCDLCKSTPCHCKPTAVAEKALESQDRGGLIPLCDTEIYNKLWHMIQGFELDVERGEVTRTQLRHNLIKRFCEWINQFGTPPQSDKEVKFPKRNEHGLITPEGIYGWSLCHDAFTKILKERGIL
jgi:hypothetical protein